MSDGQRPVSGTLRGTGRARMVSFPTVYQRVVVHWRREAETLSATSFPAACGCVIRFGVGSRGRFLREK